MVTIKDIAKQAGVSVTTVSRALNGYDDVNEETRKKIEAIAHNTGYSPNMAARSLISKKTKTLGLLLSNVTRSSSKDNIAFEVLCGMNDRSGELNYDLVLFSTTPQKQRTKSYKSLCQERGVDGVIIMGIRLDDPYLNEIVISPIPCVLIDIPIKGKNVGYVTSDNVNGAFKATKHLLDAGHRQIGVINGHSQADVSIQRLKGYHEALNSCGIPFNESLVRDGSFSENDAKEATYQLLSQHPDVTALFCASDLMALGAMQAVRGLGLQLPQDVSIVGFDNINVSAYCSPALTTINQNPYEMGYQAAQMLIDLLEGRNVNHNLVLSTELIVRESVRPLP
ncbi:LacI family DNA-binding transcriptional regulator [Paenibacillus sp. GP183]|uniref:LacI family DNA-binding transcriptional regulator n=1 Tax=Paenibacillus sp. GP183 TaxID=1882751 RepID=UPI000B80D0B4|nr:LacI family DNA-binding transcriptional regulator [Paenibacillus sp. GP183]